MVLLGTFNTAESDRPELQEQGQGCTPISVAHKWTCVSQIMRLSHLNSTPIKRNGNDPGGKALRVWTWVSTQYLTIIQTPPRGQL